MERKSRRWRSWKLRKQILWKRGRIKGRVIRRTSEDKVGNAFGFHANIILIPVSVKVAGSRQRRWRGREQGDRRVDAFKPDEDRNRSETKGHRKGVEHGTGQRRSTHRGGSS